MVWQMLDLFKKYTNENSRFLVINGTMIHYRDEGKGFPIVLLHGAFSSLHTFDNWAEKLAKEFRVVRLTYPGFGLTGPSADNRYTIKSHLNILHEFLKRLNVGRCSMVGSSLGGWITWEYALKFPAQINKLILIGSAGFLDIKSIPLPFKMARIPFAHKAFKFVIKRQVLEQFVKQVYSDSTKVTTRLVDRYYDLFTRKGNPEAFMKLANSRVKDNTLHLKELQSPTLILWGREDKWLPVKNAYRFKDKIPKSEVIIYDRLGHVPMEEGPQRTLNDARAFLNQDHTPSL